MITGGITLPDAPGAEVLTDTKTLVALVDNLPRVKEIMREIGTAHNKAAAVITKARTELGRLDEAAKEASARDERLQEREQNVAVREKRATETEATQGNRAAALKEKEQSVAALKGAATKLKTQYETMLFDLRTAITVVINGE